ncbi:hypothetical protein [Demequina aestuarii]|uniref:hypothetical protein n=1 Tax=Demequina aestuarii TaxID=327095 RepID=UPI000B08E159|nr:hypothetical protein [Demequina aestuarii]
MTARLLRASAVSVAVLALAACSWRLETPPPEWPSPSPETLVRDAAAAREQAVIDATPDGAGASGSTTAQAAVLSEIESVAAPARLEALGGFYVPYPHQSPSPSPSDGRVDLIGAGMGARDGHLAEALVTDDPDLAFLLSSAGLSHALSSWYSAWVEDAIAQSTEPVVAERLLDSPALPDGGPVPSATSIDPAVVADLVVMHDQARYAYEVLAARAADEERDRWLARRDLQDARATALAQLPGVADRRESVYVLRSEDSGDSAARLATAQDLETVAGVTYATMLNGADAEDMPWLLHAAFDAYAQAAAFGEPTAESYPVPPLPGITVGGGS